MTDHAFAPVTPGEMLKSEFLEEYGLSQNQLARAIGISPNRIAEIVNNRRRITADTAVRLGLYFQRRSANIGNWYQVMADNALRKVVYTALGLPDQTALLDVDKQKALLEKRMDIADLKKPDKVAKLLDRFAAMYDMQNGDAAATAAMPSIGPISRHGRASVISIDPSITMTLMSFPRF